MSGLVLRGLGGHNDLLVTGGLGDGEDRTARLEVLVVISVADPYVLPRLSYVVPAAELVVDATIRVAASRSRISTGIELPPTDDLGWTEPDVTPPAILGLTITLGGHNVQRSLLQALTIELDDCGGPKSANLTLAKDVRLDPAELLERLVVTYQGQRLFAGRLEQRGLELGSDMAAPMVFTGDIRQLADHKSFRCDYVDSDLDNWRTDQGPQTSANVFEVEASSD